MEPSLPKYIISILLILLGLYYFIKPDKAAKFFNKIGIGYSTTKLKYSGIFIIILGIYYILSMLGVLPMIDYWN